MGTWGMGFFEDDTACDLRDDAIDSDAVSFICNAISSKDADYIELDQCHELIISGVILDFLIKGKNHDPENEAFTEWLSQQNRDDVISFKPDVLEGLHSVLSEKSELKELWQQNEDDSQKWKSNIENLISSLTS
ncbi:DUF4259 domain-containing protein [Microbulbifer epialgicus]|uniref:DUF4259 domain-containing protein n=1 Tax=Microbulbifer epialgicus TaxID=393907 RepID=A0ABV4P663_9GAMM